MRVLKIIYIICLCFFSIKSYSYNAGYKEIINQKEKISLWYPTNSKEENISYYLWNGEAAIDSPIHIQKYPLLIFSHGYGGSRYNQSYLAEFMARNGYIVAAIEYDDKTLFQSLLERPKITSKALDFILTDLEIKDNINIKKIGMVGHSMGGYTALALAGGKPIFSKVSSSFLQKKYIDLSHYDNNFLDERIKAIAVFASGKTKIFDKESLLKVAVPVFIMEASRDELVDGDDLKQLAKNLSNLSNKYYILKGAGRFSFLPLSNKEVTRIAPETSCDPETPRKDLHVIVEKETLSFF